MHFQVHTICSAFCQQATDLIQPAEKIGTIDSICLGQYGLVSALSKKSRDYSLFSVLCGGALAGRISPLCASIVFFKVNILVIVLTWKKVKALR